MSISDETQEDIQRWPHWERDNALGMRLIEVLRLKLKSNGRVDTDWGDKTPYGLALTIKRIINEAEG